MGVRPSGLKGPPPMFGVALKGCEKQRPVCPPGTSSSLNVQYHNKFTEQTLVGDPPGSRKDAFSPGVP